MQPPLVAVIYDSAGIAYRIDREYPLGVLSLSLRRKLKSGWSARRISESLLESLWWYHLHVQKKYLSLVWERLLQSRITQLKQIINKETLNESQETIKIIRKYLLTDVTPQNEKCNLTQFATHFLHLGLKSHQTSNCMNLNKQYSIGEVHMPIWITMTKYLRLFNQGNTRIH